jgi:hypothetical protein
MVLRGQRRKAAEQISTDAKLNRIARAVPLATPQPTDGLTSQAEELGRALTQLFQLGQSIAARYRVDTEAVWTDMLERSRGQRR